MTVLGCGFAVKYPLVFSKGAARQGLRRQTKMPSPSGVLAIVTPLTLTLELEALNGSQESITGLELRLFNTKVRVMTGQRPNTKWRGNYGPCDHPPPPTARVSDAAISHRISPHLAGIHRRDGDEIHSSARRPRSSRPLPGRSGTIRWS